MHTSASAIAESRRPHAGKLSQASLLHQSDERLVSLARSGSERAWAEITRRYGHQLRVYCTRFVGANRAEDAVQQTFLQAFLSLRDGRHREIVLRAWLYRIAHNCSIDLLRKGTADYDELDLEYDGVAQPPTLFEQREEIRRLVARMRDLPDAQRRALALRELEGRSYEEISAQLGHSGSGVRQLIFRARTALRNSAAGILPFGSHHVATAVSVPASSGGGLDAAGAATLAVVAVLGSGLAAADSPRRARLAHTPSAGASPSPVASRADVRAAAHSTPSAVSTGLSVHVPRSDGSADDAELTPTAPLVSSPATGIQAPPPAVVPPVPPAVDDAPAAAPTPAPGGEDVLQQSIAPGINRAPGVAPLPASPARSQGATPAPAPAPATPAVTPKGSGGTVAGTHPVPSKTSPQSSLLVRKPVKTAPAKQTPKVSPPKLPQQGQKASPKAAAPKPQPEARTRERG